MAAVVFLPIFYILVHDLGPIAFFGLVALFAGGCALVFLPDTMRGAQYIDLTTVLIVGGIPFAVALFIVWLSLRRGNG